MHINLIYGRPNLHHMAEALFTAFARAFRGAIAMDERVEGVLSTKGSPGGLMTGKGVAESGCRGSGVADWSAHLPLERASAV